VEFQPIGVHHPRIKQLLAIQKNTTPNRHRFFVAEGLWAQQAVLAAGVGIEAFILCEEALPSDVARSVIEPLVARADDTYSISAVPSTDHRTRQARRPDLHRAMPVWDPETLQLGDRRSRSLPTQSRSRQSRHAAANARRLRADVLVLTKPPHPADASERSSAQPRHEPQRAHATSTSRRKPIEWLRGKGFYDLPSHADGATNYRCGELCPRRRSW